MRTYNTQHLHYCGVDLHARSLFVNVLDHTGQTGSSRISLLTRCVPRRRRAIPRGPRRRLRVHVRLVLAGRSVRTRDASPSSSATRWP